MLWAAAIVLAYLAGSIPFGLLVAKTKGVDLRTIGSGNIGATNVARALGKPYGIAVLILDAAKSFGPTFYATRHFPAAVAAGVAIAGVLGHVFPIWLKFKGGKGVATALGVFLAIAPIAALIAFAVYGIAYAIFRISSVGSLAGSTTLLVAMIVRKSPPPFLALAIVTWLLIVVKHRANIGRLVRGEEKRV